MKTLKTNTEGYGYKYTDLSGIHSYLEKIRASYYQYIDRYENDDYIMTVRTIDGKELAPVRGCRVVQATLSGKSNPAQEQGSALTYARRYSLLMAFGLATEDDDAESLTDKVPNKKKQGVRPNKEKETLGIGDTVDTLKWEVDVCSNCGDKIAENVARYSTERFGKKLCFKCQKLN